MSKPLILASSSPRRRDLLKQIGLIPQQIIAPEIDESPRAKELPKAYAIRLARTKAQTVRETLSQTQNVFILAADTVVACGRRILPKPASPEACKAGLQLLSGRRHHVYSAVTLIAPDGRDAHLLSDTIVAFARLNAADLAALINANDWQGCAGGYAIQGMAGRHIRFLQGSYTGVVGLPVHETYKALIGLGFYASP